MSYQEKNITVSLVSHLLITGYYLISLFQMTQVGELIASQLYLLWLTVIIVSILTNIIASILTNILLPILEAIRSRSYEDPRFIADERDELISLKGTRASHLTFSVGVLGCVIAFVIGQPALVMISGMVFFSLLSEIIGDVIKIVLYRNGS